MLSIKANKQKESKVMKKTNKQRALLAITAIFALALTACGDTDPPQPHEGTINAFGRNITVTGDASISTTNWNTAKGKLQEAMQDLDLYAPEDSEPRNSFVNMLDRSGFAIIIETGNASPDANANKQMTMGINFLLDNDAIVTDENDLIQTIAYVISQKVLADKAFE